MASHCSKDKVQNLCKFPQGDALGLPVSSDLAFSLGLYPKAVMVFVAPFILKETKWLYFTHKNNVKMPGNINGN